MGEGADEYVAARRTLAYADGSLVLDAQGNVVKGAEGLTEGSLASLALTEGAPLLSKDVSDRDQLQKLAALQMMCAHREACARLSGLLLERINVLRGAFELKA